MSKNVTLHSALKSLFLEELLADEGWSAYIDLLLNNIDTSLLQYCNSEGFPYKLDLSDYIRVDGGVHLSDMFDIYTNSDGIQTIEYPSKYEYVKTSTGEYVRTPRSEYNYFDFGEVEVLLPVDTLLSAEVREEGGWRTVWSKGLVGNPILQINGNSEFRITLVNENEFPVLQLVSLPESLNPVSIREAVISKFKKFSSVSPCTSPQSLYGALYDIIQHPFYVVYNPEDGTSVRQKSFPDYVTFYEKELKQSGDTKYYNLVSSSDVPVDPLRDSFGFGNNKSKIIGYDKKYWVVEDNSIDPNIIGLYAHRVEGDDSTIQVVPNKLDFDQRGSFTGKFVLRAPSMTLVSSEVIDGKAVMGITLSFVEGASSYTVGYMSGSEFVEVKTEASASELIEIEVPYPSDGIVKLWAMSVTSDPDKYISSAKAVFSYLVRDRQLASPVVQAVTSGETEFTISLSWPQVENATAYQVKYRKKDTAEWTIAETQLTEYQISSLTEGVYEVQVVATAEGYNPGESDVLEVSCFSSRLDNPAVNWEVSDFPATVLTIGSVENAAAYYYRVRNVSGTTEWTSAEADTPITGIRLKVGVNTVEVYAKAVEGFIDSNVVNTSLTASKLSTPNVTTSVDLQTSSVTASWQAVANADHYLTSIDGGEVTTTTDIKVVYSDLTEGQHYVIVRAVGEGYFDSDEVVAYFSVGESEFKVEPSVLEFEQRSTNSYTKVTATGKYSGEWDVKESTSSASVMSLSESAPKAQTLEILGTRDYAIFTHTVDTCSGLLVRFSLVDGAVNYVVHAEEITIGIEFPENYQVSPDIEPDAAMVYPKRSGYYSVWVEAELNGERIQSPQVSTEYARSIQYETPVEFSVEETDGKVTINLPDNKFITTSAVYISGKSGSRLVLDNIPNGTYEVPLEDGDYNFLVKPRLARRNSGPFWTVDGSAPGTVTLKYGENKFNAPTIESVTFTDDGEYGLLKVKLASPAQPEDKYQFYLYFQLGGGVSHGYLLKSDNMDDNVVEFFLPFHPIYFSSYLEARVVKYDYFFWDEKTTPIFPSDPVYYSLDKWAKYRPDSYDGGGGDGSGNLPVYDGAQVQVITQPPFDFTIFKSEAQSPIVTDVYLATYYNGVVTILCSPESRRSETSFGVVKNYDMLSIVDGRLRSVDVYIETSRSEFEAQEGAADRYIALQEALRSSIPVGVGYNIYFIYPQVTGGLKLGESIDANKDRILIDGDDFKAVSFSQRGGDINVDVATRPTVFDYEVKEI